MPDRLPDLKLNGTSAAAITTEGPRLQNRSTLIIDTSSRKIIVHKPFSSTSGQRCQLRIERVVPLSGRASQLFKGRYSMSAGVSDFTLPMNNSVATAISKAKVSDSVITGWETCSRNGHDGIAFEVAVR